MLNVRCMLMAVGALTVATGSVLAQGTLSRYEEIRERNQQSSQAQTSQQEGGQQGGQPQGGQPQGGQEAPPAPQGGQVAAVHDGPGLYVGHDGWTVVNPSPDTRRIYVSSSMGDDNNDGLSEATPKRTLAAGFAMLRDGHPDWLLLKSGDTWHEAFPFWNRSGRSESERMVVRSYGHGPRPRLLTGTDTAVFINGGAGHGTRNLVFMDLHVNAHTNPGTSDATGFRLFNGVHNVLIENCYMENYRVNIIVQAFVGDIRASNIELRRSVIVDALATNAAHAQGLFADGVDGLVMEENIFDMNGWSPEHATANIFRHNVYIQTQTTGDRGCTDVVTRGNITARAPATGFMMRTGGVSEDNLYLQNPIGLQFGQTSAGPPSSGVVRHNVFLDGLDIGHNNPRAIGVNLSSLHGAEVYGNILAHQRSGTENIQAIGIDGEYRDLTIRDNIVYDWSDNGGWRGRGMGVYGNALSNVTIMDNHFIQPRGGQLVVHTPGPAFNYAGNRYYGGGGEVAPGVSFEQWVSISGENSAHWGDVAFGDPSRDIESYMASLGRPASLESFMQEARQQSRHHWRQEFTSYHVNQWVREGFGLAAANCRADINGDGKINILDVIAFIDWYSTQDMRADLNNDGVLNILDFVELQRLMQQGCY